MIWIHGVGLSLLGDPIGPRTYRQRRRQNEKVRSIRGRSAPFEGLSSKSHRDCEFALVKGSKGFEGGLGEVDVLRVRGAARTRVDDPHKDALFRRVAHWRSRSAMSHICVPLSCARDVRSRNLKHLGLEAHPSSVSAAANDLS